MKLNIIAFNIVFFLQYTIYNTEEMQENRTKRNCMAKLGRSSLDEDPKFPTK